MFCCWGHELELALAALAERRYQEVDPSQRLVSEELEQSVLFWL